MNGKIYLLMKQTEQDIANMLKRSNVNYVFCFNKNTILDGDTFLCFLLVARVISVNQTILEWTTCKFGTRYEGFFAVFWKTS